MHNAVFMCSLQSSSNLDCVCDRLGDLEAALAADALLEGLPLDVLEDNERRRRQCAKRAIGVR